MRQSERMRVNGNGLSNIARMEELHPDWLGLDQEKTTHMILAGNTDESPSRLTFATIFATISQILHRGECMRLLVRSALAIANFLLPAVVLASPCTTGDQSPNTLLKSCRITQTTDLVSGAELHNIDICLSMVEKSGGPFGGDMIPWYFSSFSYTDASGKKVEHTFNSPNGRHNFRSLIDYSVVELYDSMFYMESHRTKYPEGSRSGTIDLHEVTFDLNSGKISLDHSKRMGVMFGRWVDQVAFEAVCQ